MLVDTLICSCAHATAQSSCNTSLDCYNSYWYIRTVGIVEQKFALVIASSLFEGIYLGN